MPLQTNQAAVESLREAIATMERKSRAEAGCLDYTFSVELNRPDVLRITEKWDSAEALAAHFRQPHMDDFRAAISCASLCLRDWCLLLLGIAKSLHQLSKDMPRHIVQNRLRIDRENPATKS
jgi:quinol monooxygenase YgiN